MSSTCRERGNLNMNIFFTVVFQSDSSDIAIQTGKPNQINQPISQTYQTRIKQVCSTALPVQILQ